MFTDDDMEVEASSKSQKKSKKDKVMLKHIRFILLIFAQFWDCGLDVMQLVGCEYLADV